MESYVYIMASKSGVFYVGVTSNLEKRVSEHKLGIHKKSFSKKYRIYRLVYYEAFSDINYAIEREKQLKNWGRKKKLFLINKKNPAWEDLSAAWFS